MVNANKIRKPKASNSKHTKNKPHTMAGATRGIAQKKKRVKAPETGNQQQKAAEQRLQTACRQLNASNRELQKQTHKLSERVKELNCLYAISELVEKSHISVEEMLQKAVNIIPASWQYPEIACARIILDDREFKTKRFRKTRWKQSSHITAHGKRIGVVEVCYPKKMPLRDEGPFLKEERSLLDALAGRLGRVVARIRSEAGLRHSEQNLATTINSIGDAVIATDGAGLVTRMNPIAEALTGWPLKKARGRHLGEIFHIINEVTREKAKDPVDRVLCQGKILRLANHTLLVSRDGTEHPIGDSAAPIVDKHGGKILGIVLVFRDLTREMQAQQALRQREEIAISLKQKELLIKEVHHRIKNNLQVVSSLLDMKSMRTENQAAQDVLTDARSKIHTMALVHSQLYESERFDRINMKIHVRDLLDHLNHVYGTGTLAISVVDENIFLPSTQAIPLAFVLNELISNAIKHAFPAGKSGRIEISVKRSNDEDMVVSIRDDGIGLPDEFELDGAESMGMKLVRQLVRHQLGGRIRVLRNKGTEFVIEFNAGREE